MVKRITHYLGRIRFSLYLHYFQHVVGINGAFSLLFGVLAAGVLPPTDFPMLKSFSFFFITFGYALAIVIFRFFSQKTRFMYYNAGISLMHLYAFGFIMNVLIVLGLHVIIYGVWG